MHSHLVLQGVFDAVQLRKPLLITCLGGIRSTYVRTQHFMLSMLNLISLPPYSSSLIPDDFKFLEVSWDFFSLPFELEPHDRTVRLNRRSNHALTHITAIRSSFTHYKQFYPNGKDNKYFEELRRWCRFPKKKNRREQLNTIWIHAFSKAPRRRPDHTY